MIVQSLYQYGPTCTQKRFSKAVYILDDTMLIVYNIHTNPTPVDLTVTLNRVQFVKSTSLSPFCAIRLPPKTQSISSCPRAVVLPGGSLIHAFTPHRLLPRVKSLVPPS